MKKTLLLIRPMMLLVMIGSLFMTHAATPEYDIQINGVYYQLQGDTAILVGCEFWGDDCIPDQIIPETITQEGNTYTVTKIADNAFNRITWLRSIQIPNTVKYIGESAFESCLELKSFYVPKSVTHIGLRAFINCDNLTSIVVDEENPVYDSREGCNAIIETATDRLTHGCGPTVVPDGVKIIGKDAFAYCKSQRSITLPNSVKVIEEYAFALSNLSNIVFSDSLERIERYAFQSDYGIKTVNLPATVTYIGEWAFALTGLDYVSIGTNDVYYSLGTNCIIERATKTIIVGSKNSYVPSSYDIQKIAPAAFSLIVFDIDLCIPRTVKEIGEYAYWKCYYAQEIDLPEGVTKIGNYAFSELLYASRLNIPSTLTEIGQGVFQSCSSLKKVNIPNSVESIGVDAFRECTNLRELTLGDGVQFIDQGAFIQCDSIETINCNAVTPPVMASDNCFTSRCYENAVLYVPGPSINDYKSTDYWNMFYHSYTDYPFDVNGDGSISINDVSILIDALLANDMSSVVSRNADANGDGNININDIILLIDYLLEND